MPTIEVATAATIPQAPSLSHVLATRARPTFARARARLARSSTGGVAAVKAGAIVTMPPLTLVKIETS